MYGYAEADESSNMSAAGRNAGLKLRRCIAVAVVVKANSVGFATHSCKDYAGVSVAIVGGYVFELYCALFENGIAESDSHKVCRPFA